MSGWPIHALGSLEGHIVPAILVQQFLVVPRLKANQWWNGQSSEGFRKLFDVRWYPGVFQCILISSHGRDDEAVLRIVLWNYEVGIPVGAPSGLQLALANSLFNYLCFHRTNFLWYADYTILSDLMTRLLSDMMGWLNIVPDRSQFLQCPWYSIFSLRLHTQDGFLFLRP